MKQQSDPEWREQLLTAYTSAIAACDESRMKDDALGLLPRMAKAGLRPDVTIYNAAITACRHNGGDILTARSLFAKMQRDT